MQTMIKTQEMVIVDAKTKSALREEFSGSVQDDFFGFGVTDFNPSHNEFITKDDINIYCCIVCCTGGSGSIAS